VQVTECYEVVALRTNVAGGRGVNKTAPVLVPVDLSKFAEPEPKHSPQPR
jgi:hypothetical protein